MVEVVVFAVAGAACLVGAVGVVLSRNPVHAALMLVMTLFGIAVLFVALQAHFIAAVQVIVYAGAIVVLFLFVIMLLGVDRAAELSLGALPAQRWTAAAFGLGGAAVLVWLVAAVDRIFQGLQSYCTEEADRLGRELPPPGSRSVCRPLLEAGALGSDAEPAATGYVTDVSAIARSLFSDYVYAFELTSLLLIVAVIGTVILARRSGYSEHGGADGRRGGESAPAENAPASQEARQ
ncbi:MAG: NADH-quinone oxidoreductase subunit J [Acidimicrobiales bacterium]|nr:NADH-quinone oxidoreductase subunit J [Acidimicrobiales bacterium]MYB80083.1 NADH-quinone oxidoreductase subunit J [Acidimicrobiales bacterium]MYI12546.1 NADH-quinone oxidoreductase subunit J [Acidimicrobiales bacterium]